MEDAAGEAGAECLGACLLGGPAFGQRIGPIVASAALGARALGGREDAFEETGVVTLENALDAPYVDQVGAEPDDQGITPWRVRPG